MASGTSAERFYALVWPQAGVVLRTAQVLVRDVNDAEDLAQETLIKAYKALDQFREGTDVRAWLMTILRNTRIDRARSRKNAARDVSLEALAQDPEDESISPSVHSAEEWNDPKALLDAFSDGQVIDAMRELPEEIRWTLLLVDVEGLDHADAGKVLGVPVGTVKSRAHRGRSMLREALTPVAREMRLLK